MNIFGALPINDRDLSDSETEVKPIKVGRKEKKQIDKNLREHYGDTVEKDPYSHGKIHDGPKVKNDYAKGEKRPYDRKSGTGNQAYGNKPKRGGHGKGNMGK